MEISVELIVFVPVLGTPIHVPSGYREILMFGYWRGKPEERTKVAEVKNVTICQRLIIRAELLRQWMQQSVYPIR